MDAQGRSRLKENPQSVIFLSMKSATVSVIGRPSAGKSTLVNTITGMKVSITSPVPQTTRNKIRGIYTDQRGQLIFTDTPGYHVSDKALNKRLQEATVSSLSDSDLILYILDPTRAQGKEEEAIADLAARAGVPVVAVINKKDIAKEKEISEAEAFLKALSPSSILKASATLDEGVDEILIELFRLAPEGELLYPEEAYTDQDLEFRISEIIREKAMESLKDELPHVIYVIIEDLEYSEETKKVWIRAVINVEREGQKGFIVGKGGENIKRIRKEAFKEIKRIFPGSKLELDIRVKADPKWRTNSRTLDRLFKN